MGLSPIHKELCILMASTLPVCACRSGDSSSQQQPLTNVIRFHNTIGKIDQICAGGDRLVEKCEAENRVE
jgi:hypothetical protein